MLLSGDFAWCKSLPALGLLDLLKSGAIGEVEVLQDALLPIDATWLGLLKGAGKEVLLNRPPLGLMTGSTPEGFSSAVTS